MNGESCQFWPFGAVELISTCWQRTLIGASGRGQRAAARLNCWHFTTAIRRILARKNNRCFAGNAMFVT